MTPNRHLAWLWRWIPPAAFYWLIHYVSTQPVAAPRETYQLDKLAHALAFAGLGLLLARAVPRRGKRVTVLLIVLAGALGAWGEIIQTGVPGRDGSVLDLAADVIGVSIGLGFGDYIWRLPIVRRLRLGARPLDDDR